MNRENLKIVKLIDVIVKVQLMILELREWVWMRLIERVLRLRQRMMHEMKRVWVGELETEQPPPPLTLYNPLHRLVYPTSLSSLHLCAIDTSLNYSQTH